MRSAIVAIIAVAIMLSAHVEICGKERLCPEGECCLLAGNMRYALPSCFPLSARGDSCRPNSKPQNMMLEGSPSQAPSVYTDIFEYVCPCHSGLQCIEGTCA